MRILVADDDPDMRALLGQLLLAWGYQPVLAEDGIRALSTLLDRQAPSIALLDSMMPGMSGPEVCRKARDAFRSRPLHITLLTALTGETEIEVGLGSGADDYLIKPFRHRELLAHIRAGERIVKLQEDLTARVRDLEAALARVKALEGMLPICMYCKKVRDDKNYWQQVETYVSQRSEARFSHGICPECEEKFVESELRRLGKGGSTEAGKMLPDS